MSTPTAQPTIGNQIGKIQEGALKNAKAVTDTLGNVRDSVNAQVKDFSTKASNFSTKEFLESNTLIAKLVFMLLVLIGFMVLLYLGITLITYFTNTSNNVYLITGINDGANFRIIPQDPKNTQAITVMRSNNESSGIEFTWSVWLNNTTSTKATSKTYSHIFSKGGNGIFESNGVMKTNNAPGVYFVNYNDSQNGTTATANDKAVKTNIVIYMNVATTNPSSNSISDEIEILGVPKGSWFNLVIRLENKVMDVYINGTLTKRHIFSNVPIQNYDDVYVCGNGGFTGMLSDLRYFNRALNVFEINNIVASGPNLVLNDGSSKNSISQLSTIWYGKNT